MKNPQWILIALFLIVASLISGCGPSEEEIATMTASSWTATPSPTFTLTPTLTPTNTPTPTPIPYDLTLIVKDQDGNPITGATVEFNGDIQTTGNDGQITWLDLPGESVELVITASGYFPGKISETIEDSTEKTLKAGNKNPA